MRWFGPSWGAPVCDEGEHVEPPFGRPCERCGEEIQEGDQGVMLAYLGDEDRSPIRAWSFFPIHLDCLVEMVQ